MAIRQQRCTRCGMEKKIGDFYKSNSIIYSYNKILTVCKECTVEIFESLFQEYKSDKIALYKICRMLDVYYSDVAYDTSKKESISRSMGFAPTYFKNINSLKQYKDRTFDEVDVSESEVVFREETGESEYEIPQNMKEFWGFGFSDSEYVFLQRYYDDLTSAYEDKTPIQRNIYKDLAVNELKKSKCQNSTDYKRYIDIQSALMNDANIKPIQDKGDDSLSTWGLWIKKIEEEEPIPEAIDEFKDVDGILGYIQKFFVKHMSRIFGLEEDDIDEEENQIKNGVFNLKSGDN